MEFFRVFAINALINSSIQLHSYYQFTEIECEFFGVAAREPKNTRSRHKGPRFLNIDPEIGIVLTTNNPDDCQNISCFESYRTERSDY